MNARRTMNEALPAIDLPPGAMELIQAGNPKPRAVEPAMPVTTEPASANVLALAGEKTSSPVKRQKSPRAVEPVVEPRPRLVTLSVRVPMELCETLLRVATDRKLQRRRPFTQQEMVAEAVEQWLEQHQA